jgi:hypothetical protein
MASMLVSESSAFGEALQLSPRHASSPSCGQAGPTVKTEWRPHAQSPRQWDAATKGFSGPMPSPEGYGEKNYHPPEEYSRAERG